MLSLMTEWSYSVTNGQSQVAAMPETPAWFGILQGFRKTQHRSGMLAGVREIPAEVRKTNIGSESLAGVREILRGSGKPTSVRESLAGVRESLRGSENQHRFGNRCRGK